MKSLSSIRLHRGPDTLIRHGHPWVFRSAIAAVEGNPPCGAVVDVLAADGEWVGRGLANPDAELAVRLFTRNRDEGVDAAFFARRVDQALALRDRLFADQSPGTETDAYRLIYSEGDLLSGLIADRYADVLSLQVKARIWEPWLGGVVDHLKQRTGISRVHIAVDTEHGPQEGLEPAAFAAMGGPFPGPARIRESGLVYEVDVAAGQKTGFYLDQRVNRRRVAAYAAGRRVLSAYCYTGAFELHAARGGAQEIVGLDSSQAAMNQAARHHAMNASPVAVEYMRGDVPQVLRRFRDSRRTFDLIVLDPPRFVTSRAQEPKGMRAYKDINLLAIKLLAPGGVLATFSCSGLVSPEAFRTVVEWATRDSGRTVTIIETLSQPPDHPILVGFPESEYLKGLICWVR